MSLSALEEDNEKKSTLTASTSAATGRVPILAQKENVYDVTSVGRTGVSNVILSVVNTSSALNAAEDLVPEC